MQTKLKAFWEKIKGFFKKLNKVTRVLLCVALAIIVIAIGAIIYQNVTKEPEYATLCTKLTVTETSDVVQFLNDNGVTDYRIVNDSILVPAGRENQLQVQLATSKILNSGFMYDYYTDHTGSFSTESERREAMRIATEEKLAAMIRQLEGIRDASVMISLGTERTYVLQDSATPSTATVLVTPESSEPLSSSMVETIRYIVAHGERRLDISDVAVSDTNGNPYTTGGVAQSNDANTLKLQFEQDTNNAVRGQVLNILEPIYGEGNVRVSVNTTVNVDRRVVESTEYSQPAGSVDGGGLIGSEKWFWEVIRNGEVSAEGGIPGTTTNADFPLYPDFDTELDGEENLAAASGDRDHKINTAVTQVEGLAGTITDVKVAVTINQNAQNSGSLTVDELVDHVATASGIGTIDRNDPVSRGRVSVMIAPFAVKELEPTDPTNPLPPGEILPGVPNWVIYAAAAGLLLFVLLVILIVVLLRRRKKKKLARQLALEEERRAAEEAAEAEAEAAAEAAAAILEAAPPTGGADIMEVNTEKSMELRKMVRQFAQNNPEIAAQMVKAWLKGDEISA